MANARFVQRGESFDYTPMADVAAGSVVVVGTLVGVADRAIKANQLGALTVRGIYDLDKNPADNITVGAQVYWSTANNYVTTASAGATLIGKSVQAAGSTTTIARVMPNSSNYIPSPSGTQLQRSGAIVLSGMTRPVRICQSSPFVFCYDYPRRVFSLFHPEYSTWNTMWDPVNSASVDSCVFGNGALDIPIPGVRYDADLYSDMAVFRGLGAPTPGLFNFKNSTPLTANSCTGSSASVSFVSVTKPGTRVFAVSDMDGDKKPDIMFVQPGGATIYWLGSKAFGSISSRTIGSYRSIVL